MKKILYISYDGMTDPLGQSQVLPYLVGLAKLGYFFTILSFEKKDRYVKGKEVIEKIVSAAGIHWVPLRFTSSPPLLSKLYDSIRMRQAAFRLQKERRFDMVHCRSYVAADIGLKLKKRKGIKFFFDMRGFWADEKMDGGQWNPHNPLFKQIYKYYKRKERQFLLQADAVVSLTEMARNELRRQADYRDINVDVIPCCADLTHFDYRKIKKEDQLQLRNRLKIPAGKKIISYLGSIGGWYMSREMFRFARKLIDQDASFLMLVLTKDNPQQLLKEAAEEGILPGDLVIAYAQRGELPLYISLSDCSIFFIRPTYSKMASSPTKHAELMGMGVPVICNAIGDTGIIINKTGTGIIVDDFNNTAYCQALTKINSLLETDQQLIRTAAFEYFDLNKGIDDYSRIYQRIIG